MVKIISLPIVASVPGPEYSKRDERRLRKHPDRLLLVCLLRQKATYL